MRSVIFLELDKNGIYLLFKEFFPTFKKTGFSGKPKNGTHPEAGAKKPPLPWIFFMPAGT
jgi:hypothetical protein